MMSRIIRPRVRLFTIGIALSLLATACGDSDSADMPDAVEALGDAFTPVPFPHNLGIPGFRFPEPAVTIDNWVAADPRNTASIYLHGWGIWAGLNADSGEMFEEQELTVFETWFTPQNILCITGLKASACPDGQRDPNPVGKLNQFSAVEDRGVPTIEGFVKYDPTAADHIIEQRLFDKTVLEDLLNDGESKIPDFPNTAIALKPVFAPLQCPNSGCTSSNSPIMKIDGPNALLAVYPGSQESCTAPGKCFPTDPNPNGFGPSDWPHCVWIDTTNLSDPSGSAPVDCSSSSAESAYNVSDFVHFQDTATEVYSVLVGMHVTSRETQRWVWQSFFWTPTPGKPPLPSSEAIANAQPSQLTSPASHYAMAIGYSMVSPAQPVTGGQHQGESIYSFNPYLEAGFSTLPLAVTGTYTYEGVDVPNRVGVQSNCMSCHAAATLNNSTGTVYGGDQYIDLEDAALFGDDLSLDFLWSIQANAVTPPS